MNGCIFRQVNLFGPCPCGREGSIYDRARKGWLCRDHSKERLCEFCQAEKAWARICQQIGGIASEVWLCRLQDASTRIEDDSGYLNVLKVLQPIGGEP